MSTKIQIEHSKVTNLNEIGFEDKVFISEHIDDDDKIKTILWLELCKYNGKDRVCLNGAAYKRTTLNNEFVLQKADVLGYHQPNKYGEETIKSSIACYDVKSLYELITH